MEVWKWNQERFWTMLSYIPRQKGSSMASIMTLKEFGYLHAINVGDSGFMIFKNK